MNILLTNVYSRKNGGDAGIVAAQLQQIERVAPGSSVVITSMEDAEDLFENTPVIHSFFYYAIYRNTGAAQRVINTVTVISASMVWALVVRISRKQSKWLLPAYLHNLADKYLKADRIVTAGGGYLVGGYGVRSMVSILLHLHAVVVAIILKKPVLLHAQSFGPFSNIGERLLIRWVLNRNIPIFVRENISLQVLKKMGIDKATVSLVADPALMLDRPDEVIIDRVKQRLTAAGVDISKPFVGITVADRFPADKQYAYELAIVELIKKIVHDKLLVLLIPQVTDTLHNDDDRQVQDRIAKDIGPNTYVYNLHDEFTYTELMALYGLCVITVCTRMHSALFSFLAGTPVEAVAYEHKTVGVLDGLGLGGWVLSIEDVLAGKLYERFMHVKSAGVNYSNEIKTMLQQLPSKKSESDTLVRNYMAQ